MAKITLDPITSGFQSTSQVNNNNSDIATNLNDGVLYRDNPAGESNEMRNLLDMNSNRIINLPAPIDPSDPVRLQDVNLDLIVDNGDFLVVSQSETQTLTSGQTTVVFVNYTTTAASFIINGIDSDRGRLLINIDYQVLNSTSIILLGSHPDGTRITLLRNEVVGSSPGGGAVTAADVSYSNITSGLTAVEVQSALDELKTITDSPVAATGVSYSNITSGLTAVELQAAVDELKVLIDAVPGGAPPIIEGQLLANGQVIVVFISVDTALSEFLLFGDDLDSRLLVEGLDYAITNSTTITLTSSYPANSLIRAVQ